MNIRRIAAPEMPPASELARNIRRWGATLEGLASKYGTTEGTIRRRLNDAGYSINGQPGVYPIACRTSPLILSAGGSAHYVGGGDYEGLPIDTPVTYGRFGQHPKPTGLNWTAIRPAGEPLTPDPANVRYSHGHTFVDGPRRAASRPRRAPGRRTKRRATDDTQTCSEPRRGGPPNKLTETQREEIVRRYVAGESSTPLARDFGVESASITYTLRRAGVTPRTKREAAQLYQAQRAERMAAAGHVEGVVKKP